MEFAIGFMRADERSMVAKAYVEGKTDALGHGPRSRSAHRHHYLRSLGKEMDALLLDRDVSVIVARDPECPEHAYGWVMYDAAGLVHWVSVKSAYRRLGIGRALLRQARDAGASRAAFRPHRKLERMVTELGLAYVEPRRAG